MYFLKNRRASWLSVSSLAESFYAPRTHIKNTSTRVVSIDLLRGIVMIIMAIDHVRDYFHRDAFLYSPTDLTQTSVPLFFTRFITHYCAPVFIFLAGTSAYLYGAKKGKKELSFFLWTRGLWLIFIELFVLSLFKTFNLTFPYFNLQVIWAIGLSMIFLSGIIYLNARLILLLGILLVGAHNLLDQFHVPGNGLASFGWSVLHDVHAFNWGRFLVYVHYPVLPWIGVMTLGYYLGRLYDQSYNAQKRRRTLLLTGAGAIVLFVLLRAGNWYGDHSPWSIQKNPAFSLLSFLNVTKYPPSLLYVLITLGPALVFLALAEKPLNSLGNKISIFGRVAMFYYLAHLLLIHTAATFATLFCGYHPRDMVLSGPLVDLPRLKGYGFNLGTVYIVWALLLLILYPLCKWYDKYKRENLSKHWWLSYI